MNWKTIQCLFDGYNNGPEHSWPYLFNCYSERSHSKRMWNKWKHSLEVFSWRFKSQQRCDGEGSLETASAHSIQFPLTHVRDMNLLPSTHCYCQHYEATISQGCMWWPDSLFESCIYGVIDFWLLLVNPWVAYQLQLHELIQLTCARISLVKESAHFSVTF